MKLFFTLSLILLTQALYSQTTVVDSFLHGNKMRSFKIYVPAIYNASVSVPLVLNLHGYTSNMDEQEFYGNFRTIADTANFIIVHPNGVADVNGIRSWNSFGLPTPDDVNFLSNLIDTVKARYNINLQRVYSTGMSNGGFMSYELASKLSNRIAAIASVTGTMATIQVLTNATTHPMPVMQIHGTADAVVPFVGNTNFISIDSLVNFWVKFNNCNPVPIMTNVPDINVADMCTAEHYVYNNGNANTTVEFYKILGGTHTWPGAPVNLGVTNMDFNASKEIWRFFRQYQLNTASGISESISVTKPYSIKTNVLLGYFEITFLQASAHEIGVCNSMGQMICSRKSSGTIEGFELNKPSIYFVKIKTGGKIFTEKIVMP
jgi:polyhydroxybutyrate depolymerase